MGRARMARRMLRVSPAMRWAKDSYQAKLGLGIFITLMVSAYAFSIAEGVPYPEALFVSIIMLFGESTEPVTALGKISVLVTMITGLIFFALIIGEVSTYLLDKIINRGKVKVVKNVPGSGHVVICGLTSKVEGILTELRSEDLEQQYPVVIVSPNANDIRFSDDALKKNTTAIVGDPLDLEVLAKANVEGARSVLVLSTDESVKGKRLYRDAYVALVYKAIYNYLSIPEISKRVKKDINVVLEFLDEATNLLPCARGDYNQPEVYTTLIPGTKKSLTVEPIYLENMPRYLFIQSIMEKDVNDIVHDLLSTTEDDTCEFYYYDITQDMVGKSFYGVEKALLQTGVTPIGVLRKSKAMGDVEGYEDANKIELLLNPRTEIKFKMGDQLVLIAYDEKEARKACQAMEKNIGNFKPPVIPELKKDAQKDLPFNRIFILNWNPYHVRDLLMEMAKICSNVELTETVEHEMEVTILTRHPADKVEPKLNTIKADISKALDRPLEELVLVKVQHINEPVTLKGLKAAGITKSNAGQTRVVIVSELDEGEESDLRALHQLQIIENRISENIFTAVELTDSKNFQFFKNTKADVVVSIEAFAEQLMAQAVLKPYVTLVFRNLLTFSRNTNEFYIRPIPEKFLGKRYIDLQKALIGYPVILVGHVRPKKSGNAITLSPKIEGTYDEGFGPARVMKNEVFKKGDRVVIITRVPEVVDKVMGLVK